MMSERRQIKNHPEPNPITNLIAAIDGARIEGGCVLCDAYQVIRAHAFGGRNVHLIEVRHDDWCPVISRPATRGAR